MIKKYLLSFVILFSSFQGCNDSLNNPTSNSTLKYLNVKIPNYNLSGNLTLRMEHGWGFTAANRYDSVTIFSSTLIRADGSFTLILNPPPEVFLKPHNGLQCAGLIFSNDEVRTYPYSKYRIYMNDELVGSISCATRPNGNLITVGDYFAYLMYSEDELFVNGNCTDQIGNLIYIEKNKLHLEKGWNIVINRLTEITDSTFIRESIVDNYFRGNWILYVQN